MKHTSSRVPIEVEGCPFGRHSLRNASRFLLLCAAGLCAAFAAMAISMDGVHAQELAPATQVAVRVDDKPLPKSSGTITPNDGGVLPGTREGDLISFPPHSTPTPLTVTVEALNSVPALVASDLATLELMRMSATNQIGQEVVRFNKPWTATIAFGACEADGQCLWDSIDEASLRCLRLDLEVGAWLPVDSISNVLTDRLECSSRLTGVYAVVADLYETSGTSSGKAIFVPIATR